MIFFLLPLVIVIFGVNSVGVILVGVFGKTKKKNAKLRECNRLSLQQMNTQDFAWLVDKIATQWRF